MMATFLIVLAGLLVSAAAKGTAKSVPPTPLVVPTPRTLFDSNCSYKNASEISNRECQVIQLIKDHGVEVILPVKTVGMNYSVLVPFVVDPTSNETTLSLDAQLRLSFETDNQNLTILSIVVQAKKAEESVIGLDFLENCLLAMDFTASEAGLDVTGEDGRHFSLNWPLESFRDRKGEKRVGMLEEKYAQLKHTMRELARDQSEEVGVLKSALMERDRMIAQFGNAGMEAAEEEEKERKRRRKLERSRRNKRKSRKWGKHMGREKKRWMHEDL